MTIAYLIAAFVAGIYTPRAWTAAKSLVLSALARWLK